MSKLSNEPQKINKSNWYYEHSLRTIKLVHRYDDGECIQADIILIPWKLLEASLQRRNDEIAARAERRKKAGAG